LLIGVIKKVKTVKLKGGCQAANIAFGPGGLRRADIGYNINDDGSL